MCMNKRIPSCTFVGLGMFALVKVCLKGGLLVLSLVLVPFLLTPLLNELSELSNGCPWTIIKSNH